MPPEDDPADDVQPTREEWAEHEVNLILERFDQTAPHIQRGIVLELAKRNVLLEADRDRLLAALKDARGRLLAVGGYQEYVEDKIDPALAGR
jgi:hypothetical protein